MKPIQAGAFERWTDSEIATLRELAIGGASTDEIVTALGGKRSADSVRARRRAEVPEYSKRHYKPWTSKAAAATRIRDLENVIAAALTERRVDWELVDQYLGGLEYLKART